MGEEKGSEIAVVATKFNKSQPAVGRQIDERMERRRGRQNGKQMERQCQW